MTLENERLHQRIAELEAQLAEATARAERVEGERDRLIGVARELIRTTDADMDGPTEAAVVDGGPFDRLKALVVNAAVSTPTPPVSIRYTNWKGETAVRTIIPRSIRYAATEWHPEPQYLVEAWCCDRQARRSFALLDFGGRDDATKSAILKADCVSARLHQLADLYEKDGEPGPRGLNFWGWRAFSAELRKVAGEFDTTPGKPVAVLERAKAEGRGDA